MKTATALLLAVGLATAVSAEPLRVLITDFTDQTGLQNAPLLGGAIQPGALAGKGAYLLGKQLVGKENYVLIDRRDYIAQVEKLKPTDAEKPTPIQPTFIHAAQQLNADVVLRGSLLSFSTGKQIVDQGGYRTEFSVLSTRVSIEALDPKDGAVIAMADGDAQQNVRQTSANMTEISESDALGIMESALMKAMPSIEKALEERQAAAKKRPTVNLAIKTSADPALIEIDGVLVGSSPLENFTLYQGDHVLTVSKAGYPDVTKRILLTQDTSIEVPMIRKQLSADEQKDILEKSDLTIIQGAEPAWIINTK